MANFHNGADATSGSRQELTTGAVSETAPLVTIFGDFSLRALTGEDLTKAIAPKLRSLLLFLLTESVCQNGRPSFVTETTLYTTLWYGHSYAGFRNNKKVYVSRLRALLSQAGFMRLKTQGTNYCIELLEDDMFDFATACGLLNKGFTAFTPADWGLFLSITGRGSLLFGESRGWAAALCARMNTSITDAYLYKMRLYEAAENFTDAIHLANLLTQFAPFNKDATEIKIRSLYRTGNFTQAKNLYRYFVHHPGTQAAAEFDYIVRV